MRPLLAIKFFLAGMVIFIVASTVSALHAFRAWELKYSAMATAPKDWRYPEVLKGEKPASLLYFTAFDLDQRTLIQRCADLAEDLKKSDAKIVLFPFKDGIERTPENMKSLERMKKTGIVILGNKWWSDVRPVELMDRGSWWSGEPVAGYRAADSLTSMWGPLTIPGSGPQDYYEFVPYGVRHTWEGQLMYDATIQAIMRFLGTGEDAVQLSDDEFRIGSHKIPLWGEGIAYAKGWKEFREPWEEMAHVEANMMTTALKYNGSGKKSSLEIYRGKIVVIELIDFRTFVWPTLGRKVWYIINSIMNDNFFVRTDSWEILLMTTFLCGSAILLFFFPTGRILVGLLLSGVAFLFYCRWLIASHNIILDPLYPLVTLAISLLLFPIVKLAHEKHALTEEVKSMNERVKALEGELKNEEKAS
ncbi:MAG: hypothetical protein HYY49_11140 [Ignavibacteriales bacterium]|nr:hypothetical protein [Ignavibacteriales bacterium]